MAHGREHHLIRRDTRLTGCGLTDAGDCRGQSKDLNDAAALRAGVPAVSPADIVCGDASLFVGRPGQGNQRLLPGDKMVHLYRVAHGVDIRD